jgi:hypothetical protein
MFASLLYSEEMRRRGKSEKMPFRFMHITSGEEDEFVN